MCVVSLHLHGFGYKRIHFFRMENQRKNLLEQILRKEILHSNTVNQHSIGCDGFNDLCLVGLGYPLF